MILNSLSEIAEGVEVGETLGAADNVGAEDGCKDILGENDKVGESEGAVVKVGATDGRIDGNAEGILEALGTLEGEIDTLGALESDGFEDGAGVSS